MPLAFAKETAEESAEISLSIMGMIANASPVVQLVILSLFVFSVLSWAIIITKWGLFKRSEHNTDYFLDTFWSGRSLDYIYSEAKKYSSSPVAKIFQSGYVELQRLLNKDKKDSKETRKPIIPADAAMLNLERSLAKAARNESVRMEHSLPFLATTGSTAPFIGLFGTVWGIMNSFQSIGEQGGASLAVVAPGIAEALVATAVGLFAAIPAVVGYNHYIDRVRNMRVQLDNFASDFLNIAKRNFLAG